MQIVQSTSFRKNMKKLDPAQKQDLDKAVRSIMSDPDSGVPKRGDLTGVRVVKFSMVKQQSLLAYSYDNVSERLILLALGTHENFYRDQKRNN